MMVNHTAVPGLKPVVYSKKWILKPSTELGFDFWTIINLDADLFTTGFWVQIKFWL